jgi:hypothetical protein
MLYWLLRSFVGIIELMTFLIIHGIGGYAGIHWQQWLKERLEYQGHSILMPEMPNPNLPDRNDWLQKVKETVAGIDISQLIIVGHSLGVTTALDYIEQLTKQIHGLVSVSGFASNYGSELNGYFLRLKQIDFEKVRLNIKRAAVLYGDNDPYVTQNALEEIANNLGVNAHIIKNGGHLNSESGFSSFKLLLDVINSEILT